MHLDTKRNCQLLNVVHRNVPCAPLDVGNERSMKASFESQVLLRPAALSSHHNEIGRKALSCADLPLDVMGGRRGHCRKSFFVKLLSQPHLSHNFSPDRRT